MSKIRPFRAWRPAPDLAAKIASPPYDVVSSEEAREMARDNDLSFLHVVKPEIDLPVGTDLYSDEVYATGARNLKALIDRGALIREETPCLYVYQQRMGDHVQAGIVGGTSVQEYEEDRIRKHEHTRRVKEDDRTRHVDTLNANAGPVFLTYPAQGGIDSKVDEIRSRRPAYDFTSPDGIVHTAWIVSDPGEMALLQKAFGAVDALYVADGHHRSASAARVGRMRRESNPSHTGDEEYNYFLSVLFPHNQLKILAYNRVVRDLNGLDPGEFLDRVSTKFAVSAADAPSPPSPREFGMFLDGTWRRLKARPGTYPEDDPIDSLDVAILQNNLLGPVLGIEDPRADNRIDFVGGIRGTAELEKRCGAGWAVAFALYPTSIEQLMSVADAGRVMPPKSTWFEPKLRSGLLVRSLDG